MTRAGLLRPVPTALLIALACATGPASAQTACVARAEATETISLADLAAGWCLAGAVRFGEEQHVVLDVPAPGLWRVTLEALPGQVGEVGVAAGEAGATTRIWSGTILGPTGAVASPPLFLAAGPHDLVLRTAEATMVYRLRVAPGEPLPPDRTDGTHLAGAFAVTVRGTDSGLVLPWSPGDQPPGLWTLAAHGPLGFASTLELRDGAGSRIVYTESPAAAGVFRLPDLALPAGDYEIVIRTPPPEMPVLVTMVAGIPPANFAAEPDGETGAAHLLLASSPVVGRLATSDFPETDFFAFDVPADGAARLYDVSLTAASDADLLLALTDAEGRVLVQDDGARQLDLRGLVLPPGRHFVKVYGALPPEVTYTLLLEVAGQQAAAREIEPNNLPEAATPLSSAGLVTGTFTEYDRDYINLGITGALQLWEVEAIGDGIERLALYDGAGQEIATASPQRDRPVVRLSHLLLPPGNNVIRIEGSTGGWQIRARPLGSAVAGEEIEPNDDPTRALVLAAGQPQTGWLDYPDDHDLYAFHLDAPHRVTIALTGPADLPIRMTLAWGDRTSRIAATSSAGARGEPQLLAWDGLLPPGDYLVELRPLDGISREPYRLALDLPPYFDRPLDLEPNNAAWQASLLPRGQELTGTLQGDDDADWYRLDPAFGAGTVEVVVATLGASLQLRLARGTPAEPETLQQLDFATAGETATLTFPTGEALLLRVSGAAGAYAIAIGDVTPAPTPAVESNLVFDLAPVAAYETVAQRLDGTLAVRNTGKGALTLRPAAWVGSERWVLSGLPETIALAAGATATFPVTLEIPADARDDVPIHVDVGLSDGVGPMVTARARVTVSAGVVPVAPHRFDPLPPGLLGGIDLAWLPLGAVAETTSAAGLFDGIVDAYGVRLDLDAPVAVRLAGDVPAPIVGVILQLPPGTTPVERLADFAVEVSADGRAFTRVLEARLSPLAREQAFLFDGVAAARFVRLVPLSAHGGPAVDLARLAEFQVIAEPGFTLRPEGFDVAATALGGHVVRASGFGDQMLTGENAAWPGDYTVTAPADREVDPQWVIGFLGGRAALVTTLVWHERNDAAPDERIREVEVSASRDGPFGPWTVIGTWRLDDAATSTLALAEPLWARAVAFRVVLPATGRLALPDHIEIRESAGPSILGAWGDLARTGPYEAGLMPRDEAIAPPGVSRDPLAPAPLDLGEEARGEVRRGIVESWYSVVLPEGTQSVRAAFADARAPGVAMALVAFDGREIAFAPDAGSPGMLVAPAEPGAWRLRVSQPVASVVVAWDTSDSVAGFYPAVARMIRRVGGELRPDREAVNLLPFRGSASTFLMPEWSGEPAAVYAAIHAYPLRDSSSDAESALLFAAERLGQRVGDRAVVLVTDASFSGAYRNEELWQSLQSGNIAVFALYLPADGDARRALAQTSLMADWAGAAGGHLSRFAAQGDAEVGFRRLAAWLARPADYAFTLAASADPPAPGGLIVRRADAPAAAGAALPGAAFPAAMAIILDASGSMLQRLGDRTRIDVARDVLRDLGRSVLPEGLPVALRVFGHDAPGSCANELFLPLAPLDRDAFVAAVDRVQSVNLARTSIAATLRQAGEDLAQVTGARSIVLITDGEETCGGDPLAEIERLRAAGLEISLNIVGFAIGDAATRSVFEAWATRGGGTYFDAADAAALGAAIRQATSPSFVVLDGAGLEVARGTVGGPAVALPPGVYTVTIGGGDGIAVTVRSGGIETVAAPF